MIPCMGPRGFAGCPYGADVMDGKQIASDGVIAIMRYWHCSLCFEVYQSQRRDGESWPGDPFLCKEAGK